MSKQSQTPPFVCLNEPLSKFTTFQLGAKSKGLIPVVDEQQCLEVIQWMIEHDERFILIGGGSNLVVSDKDLDVYVIRFVSDDININVEGQTVTVCAAIVLDDLALYCANNGLGGINMTSGIPGTVGGAVVGNAGAFGKQIGDVIESVKCITKSGEIKYYSQSECGFTYRHSKLKESSDIVLSVTLNLYDADSDQLLAERQELLDTRCEKHPNLQSEPCAGSFFRNVEPTSKAGHRQAAGWFLDQAGGKALTCGGAKIYSKHANIIVKTDGCTAEDVYGLSVKMADIVKNAHDLELVREVRFVGEFSNKPAYIKEEIW